MNVATPCTPAGRLSRPVRDTARALFSTRRELHRTSEARGVQQVWACDPQTIV